jgi:hypothetical protein
MVGACMDETPVGKNKCKVSQMVEGRARIRDMEDVKNNLLQSKVKRWKMN